MGSDDITVHMPREIRAKCARCRSPNERVNQTNAHLSQPLLARTGEILGAPRDVA